MSGTSMGHDDAREHLAALALGALDATEATAVRAHVGGCAECSAELAELSAAAASVALSATPSADNAARASRVKERLLARVSASKDATLASSDARKPGWSRAERTAVAASVLLLASAGLSAVLWRDRGRLQDELAALDRRNAAVSHAADSLRFVVSARDSMIAGFTGRDMGLVRLTSSATREAWALMFWNRSTNGWTFVAHNLPQPARGRTYQLWLVTADAKKISAGTFAPGADGEAVVRAVYALGRTDLKAVAVTDEPAGGVMQPTGAFVVIGTPEAGH